MSDEQADKHLNNLRKESMIGKNLDLIAPPPNHTPRKSQARKKPNRSGAARISARRIGGPNITQQLEIYKQQQKSKAKTATSVSSGLQPVNLGKRTTSQKSLVSSEVVNPVMPKVQELGVQTRRSSSRMAISIDRVRSNSTFSNNSNKEPEAKEKEAIIRYGDLLKKGVVTQSWKKRFFVLTDKHLLYYLESFDVPQELHQIEGQPRGQIEITLITEIRKDKGDKSGATFHLVTPTRVYKMRAEGENARLGAEVWMASISGAIENAKQQQHGMRGVSFASMKVDEVDTANQTASTYKHPAKRLVGQETYASSSNKGPHKPAALEEYEAWTPFDVAAWLYTVHLQKYSEEFYKIGVDGKRLKKLTTAEDAKELGVDEEDIEEFMKGVDDLKTLEEVVAPFSYIN